MGKRPRRSLKGLPSLDLLRCFDAAARHLSFTKAGEELHVTQSAVSRRVRALESQLGVELFHRHVRALTLTGQGRALQSTLSSALGQLEDAVERLAAGVNQRSIAISTTIPFAALWLIPRLGGFRLRHPDIGVRVKATGDAEDPKRKSPDLAVCYVRPDEPCPDALCLFEEQVVAVCSPALVGASSQTWFAPRDLQRHVLLHMDDVDETWPWLSWRDLLERLDEPELTPAGALHFSQYDQLIQAAVDGHGIALGRRPLIDRHLREQRLVKLFADFSTASGAYFLVSDRDPSSDADIDALMAWLLEEARGDAAPDLAPTATVPGKPLDPRGISRSSRRSTKTGGRSDGGD
jgi:LysR family transcriptional regulator, glycine cleavage system transcriptional activator